MAGSKENSVIFLLSFGFFILVFIALYVCLGNWLYDENSRTLVTAQYNRLRTVYAQNALNQRTSLQLSNKGAELDTLITQCQQTRARIAEDQVTLDTTNVTVNYYNALNTTILSENATCNEKITNLNTTVGQLRNVTSNETIARTVSQGTCQFNSVLFNDTITVGFTYRVLPLNGVDFYYYTFENATGVVEGSEGVRIEGCSPILFRGTTFTKLLSGTAGLITNPPNYLSHLVVGNERLQFVPLAIPTPGANMTISTFQISVLLF
jgi:hypothetical protein